MNKYPDKIYAVYEAKEPGDKFPKGTVRVFCYPAKRLEEHTYRCKVYLNTQSPHSFGMIRLPTNMLYKTDFRKPVQLINCTVTYYEERSEAKLAASEKIRKFLKKAAADAETIRKEICSLQEKLFYIEESRSLYSSGYLPEITESDNRKDSGEFM